MTATGADPKPAARPRRTGHPLSIAAVALLYFATAKLGLSLASPDTPAVTLIWPPTGIALAALVVLGHRVWIGIFAGAFLANVTGDTSVVPSLGIALGNTAEALVGAYILSPLTRFDGSIARMRDVGAIVFAAVTGGIVGATFGAISLCWFGDRPWAAYPDLWSTWWLGDTMGAVLVAPVLMTWARVSRGRPAWRDAAEAAGLATAALATAWFVYGGHPTTGGIEYPIVYLSFPLLIWGALRFGQRGATAVVILIAVPAVWGTVRGHGPFSAETVYLRLTLLHVFLSVFAVTGLCLGAAMTARKRAERRLRTDHLVTQVLANAATLEQAAPQILSTVCETLRWEMGAVWRVDAKAGVLRCVETWHADSVDVPEFEADTRVRKFARGAGLPGRVWASGRPVWIDDVVRDPNFPRAHLASKERLHGAFGLPIRLGDEVLGVIEFFSWQIREPDQELIEMMTAVGAQIGQFMERNRVESLLVRGERELSDFFENAALGLHWAGPDGIVQRVNQAELEMLGYARDEYVGRHIAEFHVDKDAIADILARLARGEDLRSYEARLVAKDGTIRHVVIDSNVLWEDGRFVHTRCFTRDVTDRKKAEQALRNSEERFRVLAEGVPSVIWTASPDGRPTYVNPHWFTFCGISPDTMATAWPGEIIHPEDEPRRSAAWGKAVREGLDYEIEIRARRHDGVYRWMMTRAVPLRDASGRVTSWFGITTDIHDQKEAQEVLKENDRRKDEFLATLAHELRNPLAPLSNALQLLRVAQDDAAVRGEALGMADRQLQNMVRLVDDLLDVSRITRGKIQLRVERVLLADLVARAVETSRPGIEERGHTLTVTLPKDPVALQVDPTRIAQVVSNLLNNAARYGGKQGQIRLTASVEQASGGGNGAGGTLTLRVADTGIGIAPEMLPRIFEPFVQAKGPPGSTEQGLGIGLALVKRLVEMHGGRVEAASAGLGRGSEFTVRLPLHWEPPAPTVEVSPESFAAAAAAAARARAPAPRAHLRVLVVDDNQDSAKTMAMLLRKMGHEVDMAFDGLAAVQAVSAFDPDIVLLDIGMPTLDGYEAARRIRALPGRRTITLVALTGWGQAEDRRRSKEAGFDHHLVKPVGRKDLDEILAQAAAVPGAR